MQRIIIVVLVTVALAGANPIIATLINEIQVAPDSLERMEINPRYWPGGYADLSGCQVITRAGTAIINSGVIAHDTDSHVVIDRHNTTGTFGLADDWDQIALVVAPYETLRLSYPSDSCDHARCWRAPSDMSCARYSLRVLWPMPDVIYYWYLDSTPSFGMANDDSAGGIFGTVRNQHGQPVCSAEVRISGPNGGARFSSDGAGTYRAHPTGPGTFWVMATRSGNSGAYPDSVHVGTNESRTGIDITVPLTGEAEYHPVVAARFDWPGKALRIVVAEPALADVKTFNQAGQVRRHQTASLAPGINELDPIADLPAGAYVVQVRIGKESFSRKIVVY